MQHDTYNQVCDPRDVFIIHGRNERHLKEFCIFLRALDLRPFSLEQVANLTGLGSPHIDLVLRGAMRAQAVVGLLTPDEEVRLSPELAETPSEGQPRYQPRPNVLLELGMALIDVPKKTLVVVAGEVSLPSDILGRLYIHLDNRPESRLNLANRLSAVGCSVNTEGVDWLDVGDLTPPQVVIHGPMPGRQARRPSYYKSGYQQYNSPLGHNPRARGA